jgi:hypothetical protein
MAFLDHIDPGNSGGSIPTPPSPFNYKPKPIIYKCEYCECEFESDADKRQHKIEQHPVRKPYLYIEGSVLTASEMTIRSTLESGDIAFEDADSVKIDNQLFSDLSSAKKYLLDNQKGGVDIELSHQNYTSAYRLIFDVADHAALVKIDGIFYDVFSSSIPLARRLELFNEKVRLVEGRGLSYAGALGCYITAIMAKDGVPEVAIPFSDHIDKLGEAQDKLQGISRPLAYSLGAIIAFMLNDLGEREEDSYIPKLSTAKKFLRTGKFEPSPSYEHGDTKIPIDMITDKIMGYCESPEIYRKGEISSLEMLYETPTTPQMDKLKLALILYNNAKLSGQHKVAEKYEKQLSHSSLSMYAPMRLEGKE